MAGDWLKIEHTLPDKPEVDQVATLLEIDPDSVVGKLVRLWSWADQHSINGNAICVTEKALDRKAGHSGFCLALRKVGWLAGEDGNLSFPNFARHNGQTAKSRAETNRRVSNHRYRNENVTQIPLPEALQKPLPEKRREENTEEPPKPPAVLAVDSQVASLHRTYCELTANDIQLTDPRSREWSAFVSAGFNEDDMKRVVHLIRKGMNGDGPKYNEGSLAFSTLIGNLGKFEERLIAAKKAPLVPVAAKKIVSPAQAYGLQ